MGAGVGSGSGWKPTRSSSAATTAGCPRWRCCRTAGWSAAGMTIGCWCGIRISWEADPVELGRHDGRVSAVAVLPDGRVVSGGADGRVLVWGCGQVWDELVELAAMTVQCRRRPRLGPGRSTLAATTVPCTRWRCLADGRVGSAAEPMGGCWSGLRPRLGRTRWGLRRHEDRVLVVVVLPDGRVVSGGADRRVQLWSSATAPTARSATVGHLDRTVSLLAVLPDGRVVSSGTDRRVWVWDRDGPVEIGSHNKGVVLGLAVLPDGRVVSSGVDGRILVWDAAATELGPVELVDYGDPIPSGLAVLPDGRLLCGSAGRDGDDGSTRALRVMIRCRWTTQSERGQLRCCRMAASSADTPEAGAGVGPASVPQSSLGYRSDATQVACGRCRCCRTDAWSAGGPTGTSEYGTSVLPRPVQLRSDATLAR